MSENCNCEQANHFTTVVGHCLFAGHCLKALKALDPVSAFWVLLGNVLLQRVFVAVTFVTKGTLRRHFLFVESFGLIEYAIAVKPGRNSTSEFTRQRNA